MVPSKKVTTILLMSSCLFLPSWAYAQPQTSKIDLASKIKVFHDTIFDKSEQKQYDDAREAWRKDHPEITTPSSKLALSPLSEYEFFDDLLADAKGVLNEKDAEVRRDNASQLIFAIDQWIGINFFRTLRSALTLAMGGLPGRELAKTKTRAIPETRMDRERSVFLRFKFEMVFDIEKILSAKPTPHELIVWLSALLLHEANHINLEFAINGALSKDLGYRNAPSFRKDEKEFFEAVQKMHALKEILDRLHETKDIESLTEFFINLRMLSISHQLGLPLEHATMPSHEELKILAEKFGQEFLDRHHRTEKDKQKAEAVLDQILELLVDYQPSNIQKMAKILIQTEKNRRTRRTVLHP